MFSLYQYFTGKKRNVPCIFEVSLLGIERCLVNFISMYKLGKVTTLKMNIVTEAIKFMSEDTSVVLLSPNTP